LKKDKAFLVAHPEFELSETEEDRFADYIERRSNREPLQHITGIQEFWGLEFYVSKDVLIPRQETEIIVEQAIRILSEREYPTFCEIGIGSGCIAVSILNSVVRASAIGLDISENALKVAVKNAAKHRVNERLQLRQSDLFESLETETFDLIASNPPYIPQTEFETLQAEVRDFDPRIALTDGKNGLSIIERIVSNSPQFLKPNGYLLMEIGINQADFVSKMFSSQIWKNFDILTDLQGIPRTIRAQKL
jgi:release factor glutamine methyltransferase